ncbi:MAG TPA: CARDB domain-containing protein, partial [Luteimonas sp.]|nr:CARDB domain-containing protein [Luteimonas sp.]
PALRCLPQTLIAALPTSPGGPPSAACPAGWRPVPTSVNPVLRCLPDRRASGPAAADGKPAGCPAGWTPVPPGVNPLLRCLPANIAPLARPQAGAPGGCPKGWKPAAPGLNPLMRCTPGSLAMVAKDPLQGGPGTGDPGQGRDAAAKRASSDLVLVDAFQIGGITAAWNGSANVPASAASSLVNGACKFAFTYRTANEGGVGTAATANGIRRDTQNGAVLATTPLAALAGGASAVSMGHVTLKPGTTTLHVHADAPGTVTEYSEPNNRASVQVTVTGSCAG